MNTMNIDIVMSILLALTIIAAFFFGQRLLALPYATRITIAAVYVVVFGSWIMLRNAA